MLHNNVTLARMLEEIDCIDCPLLEHSLTLGDYRGVLLLRMMNMKMRANTPHHHDVLCLKPTTSDISRSSTYTQKD